MMRHHLRFVIHVLCAAALAGLLWVCPASAQTTVLLEGTVRDQGGAALAGVSVTLTHPATGATRSTTTDGAGHFRFVGLGPALVYELTVAAQGFSDLRLTVSDVSAGDHRTVDMVLPLAGITQEVSVTADDSPVKTTTPALGGLLRQEQAERVPVDGRDLIDLAYLLPGAAPARGYYNLAPRLTINGASSLVTNYTVDGFDNTDLFLGGPKVPVTIGATQNLNVLVNSYSVEYGRTGNGVFAVTTRSGSNTRSGEVFYQMRPGQIVDAPNYFAPRDAAGDVIDDSFVRHQAGGTIGGPIVADRLFYFANAEATWERQDAILTSPLAAGLAPTAFNQLSGAARLDWRTGDTGTTTFRYLGADYTHDKDVGFIGGLTLPSAGLEVGYRNHFASVADRRLVGAGALETGVMVGRMRANWHTADQGPRVNVTDRGATLAVIGGVSDDFFWTETDIQGRAVYTWLKGRHTVKGGADLLLGLFDIRPGPGARGAYVVDLEGRTVRPQGQYLAISDLPRDVKVLSYSQTFVNPAVDATQTLAAAFVEDSIRLRSDLSLTVGARWDYDSVTNTPDGDPDLNNLGPRAGLSWSPGGSVNDQIRAGAGWFYERIPFAVYSDTIFNGPDGGAIGVTFVPGTGFEPPAFPAAFPRDHYRNVPLNQLPPRNVQVFDPSLKSPWTRQLSVGYQRELPWGVSAAIDYVHASGENLVRRIDLNAPSSVPPGVTRSVAAADATRPTVPVAGGFRLIEQDETTGRSRFHGLYLNVRKRLSGRVGFDVAWTISKAENDTDDINFRPVDSRRPDAEYGPSFNDRRHVVAINGIVRLPLELDLSPVVFLSTGQPLNVTTGLDDNGDTIYNDRPVGYDRNSERTAGYRQVDLSLSRRFAVGGVAVVARADVFNVFNAVNYSGFFNFGASGVRPDEAGTLAFQPTVAGPARQFQISVRVAF
jgi:hypothetical protein